MKLTVNQITQFREDVKTFENLLEHFAPGKEGMELPPGEHWGDLLSATRRMQSLSFEFMKVEVKVA